MTDAVGQFQIGAMAEMLAEPGLSSLQAVNRLRHFASEGLLHSYGARGTGKTAPRLYPLQEVCKAKVLFALIETGVADLEVLAKAEVGLNANDITGASPTVAKRIAKLDQPIKRAMDDVRNGGWPVFSLTYFRHVENGSKFYKGEVFLTNERPDSAAPSKEYAPRSGIVIQLAPLLLPLLRDRSREN